MQQTATKYQEMIPMTYELPRCDTPSCPGHLGKFADCVAEALWVLSMDSSQDEQTGDAIDWHMWAGLFVLESSELVEVEDARSVEIPAGAYVLVTGTTGFVDYSRYDSESDARDAFSAIDRDYSEFLGEDDEDAEDDGDRGSSSVLLVAGLPVVFLVVVFLAHLAGAIAGAMATGGVQ